MTLSARADASLLPRRIRPRIIGRAALALAFAALSALPAAAIETRARSALVLDATTGTVLMEKNADLELPPASMSKLMTLNMVFEALEEGRLTLQDEIRVSAHAASMGGSTMFLREKERVTVDDLLQGVIVQSGNDASVALAEALAGTEEAFAARMNARAKELGLTHSHFANATGWPDPAQYMSARDLVKIATRIVRHFPQHYHYFAEREFTWDGVTQPNRNPLLGAVEGADGLKTGHTAEAGYGLVGSVEREGRRVVFMFGGLDSQGARSEEAEQLASWAFRQFSNEKIYAAGEILGVADVWIGARPQVGLTVAEDLLVTLPIGARRKLTAKLDWQGPLEAPIEKGAEVATLTLTAPDMAPITVPVVAAETVGRGGYLTRVKAAASLLLRDLTGEVEETVSGVETPVEGGAEK